MRTFSLDRADAARRARLAFLRVASIALKGLPRIHVVNAKVARIWLPVVQDP